MNKILLNRLALLGLVACTALPVFAQTKTTNSKMADTKMSGKMDKTKMSGDKMSGKMDNKMSGSKMMSDKKMDNKMSGHKMMGNKMSGSKMMSHKMSGHKMNSSMEARRLAWYKKTYGAQWKHHYNPKM